jgi:hypothetical protein
MIVATHLREKGVLQHVTWRYRLRRSHGRRRRRWEYWRRGRRWLRGRLVARRWRTRIVARQPIGLERGTRWFARGFVAHGRWRVAQDFRWRIAEILRRIAIQRLAEIGGRRRAEEIGEFPRRRRWWLAQVREQRRVSKIVGRQRAVRRPELGLQIVGGRLAERCEQEALTRPAEGAGPH